MVEVSEQIRASPDPRRQLVPDPVEAGGPTAECIEMRWAGGPGGLVRGTCDGEGPDRSEMVAALERIRARAET